MDSSKQLLAIELASPGAASEFLEERTLTEPEESFRVALIETQHHRDNGDFMAVVEWLEEHDCWRGDDTHGDLIRQSLAIWRALPDTRQARIAEAGPNEAREWSTPDPTDGGGR